MTSITDIDNIKNILSEVLADEWEAQGHKMTGSIIDNIEYIVKQTVNELTLTGMIYPYGNYQAWGAKWTGKGPPIKPLQDYVIRRMGITDEKKSKSIAFAIATNLKKEGLPTQGGFRFTKTGKRTEWIGEAFKKNEDRIGEAIAVMVKNRIEVQLDVMINRWNITLNK